MMQLMKKAVLYFAFLFSFLPIVIFPQLVGTGIGFHSVVSSSSGTVYACGDNSNGQLGNGNSTSSNVPVSVNMSGALKGKTITKVACGSYNSLALASDGAVYSWEKDANGRLGDGNNTDSNVPVATSNLSPLPVGLTTFTADNLVDKADLQWNTATEVDNYGFEIERSAFSDQRSEVSSQSSILNRQWQKIGFVKGNGNSNSPKSYSFVDDNSINGTVEYGLKQIDNNGVFKYLQILTVNSLPIKFELSQNYPNPFNPTTAISYQHSAK